MEPSASPLMMAEVTRMVAPPVDGRGCSASRARRRWDPQLRTCGRQCLLRQRQDLTLHEVRKEVVLFRKRILVFGAERLLVGLNQAGVAVDGIEGLAHLGALKGLRLGDRQRGPRWRSPR